MQQQEAEILALSVIPHLISDDEKSMRFLAISGLNGDQLRDQIEEPGFQAAVLKFFLDHEPDLLEIAENLGTSPDRIARAWQTLNGPPLEEWP